MLSLTRAILTLLQWSAIKNYFTHNSINLIIGSETDDKVEMQVSEDHHKTTGIVCVSGFGCEPKYDGLCLMSLSRVLPSDLKMMAGVTDWPRSSDILTRFHSPHALNLMSVSSPKVSGPRCHESQAFLR